jgi:cytochrome c-type biogenesis protein CcmH
VTAASGFLLSALALMILVVAVLSRTLWRGWQHGAALQASFDPVQANAQVYRDQLAELERDHRLGQLSTQDLDAARDEIARRVLEDVSTPSHASTTQPLVEASRRGLWAVLGGVALLMCAGSITLYSLWGQPEALDPLALKQGVDEDAQVTPEKLAAMATALTKRLQDEPNSTEGWVMLGRVQRALQHFDEADEALRHALDLSQDPNIMIERAEVLAQKNQGSFAGEPWAIIQRVLEADPNQLNALLLAGSASFSELNYRSALRFWERARETVPADSNDAVELDRAIAQARDKLGLPEIPPRAQASVEQNLSQRSISGRVSLVNELANQVSPNDTVFIYATAVAGSRMPLAIVRTTVARLPFDFVLDDSTAMNPNAKLSGAQEVSVQVRISKTGQAMPQPGDLGVTLTPVKLGSHGLNLMVRETLH